MGARRGCRIAAVGAVAALLLTPPPADARVTVTVQVAYGGVVAGGVGFFLYLAGSWQLPFADRGLPTALLELDGDGARIGVPLPLPDAASGLDGEQEDEAGVHLDLVRWRF